MNYRMIGFVIGRILLVEAGLLVLPLIAALIYGDTALKSFAVAAVICAVIGLALTVKKPRDSSMYAKEGFVSVALAWIVMSLFGALPFYLSGAIPSFIDCFFETVSGFTTTGSSILRDVEALENSLLFWRSFTHWVGGMGVLVFVMAVLPMSDGHGMYLLRAEIPGPSVGKLVSKMGSTAKILYAIYFAMTAIEVIMLVCGGMPLFDALVNSFGTAGTGGFSHKALSIGYYDSVYFDMVIGTFMLLFGVNFNLYYFLLIKRFREVFRSEELWTYIIIVLVATLLIAVNIMPGYDGFCQALRYAYFQVSAIITTTGYSTADFTLWPVFSQALLVMLMFFGGCAGSTAGGMKIARIIILAKTSRHDVQNMIHPNAVTTVRFEGKPQKDKQLRSVHLYFTIYIAALSISVMLLSLENFDLVTTFTAVATCLNNIGPGLGAVGPAGSFADFSVLSKLLLSFDMLLGRLEIFPLLILFYPAVWKRKKIPRSVK